MKHHENKEQNVGNNQLERRIWIEQFCMDILEL